MSRFSLKIKYPSLLVFSYEVNTVYRCRIATSLSFTVLLANTHEDSFYAPMGLCDWGICELIL